MTSDREILTAALRLVMGAAEEGHEVLARELAAELERRRYHLVEVDAPTTAES